MAGLFNQAMIDPDSGELVKNGSYYVYQTDGETLATIYTDTSESGEVAQPLTTSAAGNATFWVSAGLYKLSRGGDPVDIQIDNPVTGSFSLGEEISHLGSIDFDPACYFSHAYQNFDVIASDYTLPTPDPSPNAIYYSGSDDITITFPDTPPVHQNAVWPIYNLGSGSIQIDTGTSPLLNVNSHTKIDGAGAIGFVTQTADTNEGNPEYALGGVTSP